MADETTSNILNFGPVSETSESPNKPFVPSHLSQSLKRRSHSLLQSRSKNTSFQFNAKRVKPNSKPAEEHHALEQLETAKRILDEAIDLVLESKSLKYGYEFYYKKTESVCKFRLAEQSKLSDRLKAKIETKFYDDVNPKVINLVHSSIDNTEFIRLYLDIYQDWENKLRLLNKLFLYMDRSYLLQHPRKQMILELGLTLFLNNLLANPIEEADLTLTRYTAFLDWCHRQQDTDDLKLLDQFTRLLIKLNFDGKIKINGNLIDLIVSMFDKLRYQWFKTPETYVHTVLSQMSKEVNFFKSCGHTLKFCDDLLKRLKWTLLYNNYNEILSQCFPYLLSPDNSRQLEMIYELGKQTLNEYNFDSVKILLFEWGQLIYTETDKLIQTFEKDKSKNLINSLVELHNKFKNIADTKFIDEPRFELEIRSSFSKCLNQSKAVNHLIINQLCRFNDSFLKQAKKGADIFFETVQENFLTIFKNINNKNDFIVTYKKELSRRLLLSKTIDHRLERTIISSILQVVGESEDTIGLNTMFKDLEISKQKYSLVPYLDDKSIDFSALILEKKYWPEIPKKDSEIILPQQFSSMLDQFTVHYHNSDERAKGHNLDWSNYSLHQVTMVGHFESGDYELLVNLLQATVLCLFEDHESLSFEKVMELTNIDGKLLKRIITSLTEKYKVLIEEDNKIFYNSKFIDKSKKIRIPLAREKDASSVSEVEKTIAFNRDSEIRSAVIRIMKQEKLLLFNDLINKTLVMIKNRGPISISDLKSNIEYLITNEYLNRKSDNQTLDYIP